MSEALHIRPAQPHEAGALTDLAVAAKAHWGYPASAMEKWQPDLAVTREAIAAQPVFVAERDGVLLGALGASGGTGDQDEAVCGQAVAATGFATTA